MSALSQRPIVGRRTWLILTGTDALIWIVAEVQHTSGTAATAFDAVWLVSFFGFMLLLVLGVVAVVRSRR